jgi:hypothetical protein
MMDHDADITAIHWRPQAWLSIRAGIADEDKHELEGHLEMCVTDESKAT